MGRPIKRRDFLNGVAVASLSSMMPGQAHFGADRSGSNMTGNQGVYPPLRTGMRGSHPGAFEVAHQLGRDARTDWGPVQEDSSGDYDLVVVGAGISGLSAAHFYRKEHPNARILILDNHDDFGGHAKRNEFQLDDRMFLGHGGSQTIQEPGGYSKESIDLLKDLGIDTQRLGEYFDQQFYQRHGLSDGVFFDRSSYGVDRVVRYPIADYSSFLPLIQSPLSAKAAVAQMPLGDRARLEMQRLLEFNKDQLAEIPAAGQKKYLRRISYRDFLSKHAGVTDPEVFKLFQGLTADAGSSIETSSALGMMGYGGLPGLKATALTDYPVLDEPYIHHFPDGNASVARLLVRKLIPRVAAGSTMEDIVTARFDYGRLDELRSPVRLRLQSTAVRVENDGPPESAKRVGITYVRNGQAHRVWGRSCVLAGYNAMVRHLCPSLPETQRDALAQAGKTPIIYTNVLLNNWRAWKKLGIGCASAPGAYHSVAFLDFPVSIGDYQYSQDPEQPIVVHMERFPKGDDHMAPMRDQIRAGKHELFSTSFESIEREIRSQLSGMLSSAGFDAAKDIEAITVNRWGHGYSNWYSDFDYEFADDAYPHIIGRQRHGRIAIANSDAGASTMMQSALDQAHRAISELEA
jgi:spermidine dehydrogenase|tara:strand:- start:774 stop:2666 length:1893 start_codon:yes stop_codon:yes gene_type:complete